MMFFIRFLLFCLSSVGCWELLRRYAGVPVAFLPSLTVAVQTVILFGGGLLNLLPECTLLLYIAGFLFLLDCLRRDRNPAFLKEYAHVGLLFLAATLLLSVFLLRGKVLTGLDDFSHWGLIVRQMLRENRYPNFQDAYIEYREYVPGSATYLYFFSQLVGADEWIWMLGQTYMMLTAVLPLFLPAGKQRLSAAAALLAGIHFILIFNGDVTLLLVDTLLPLAGMCGLLYAYLCCGSDSGIREWCWAACYMAQMLLMKNSGLYFAALVVVWMLWEGRKDKKALGGRTACALCPFLTLLLWHKHCRLVFDDGGISKHAMTVANYRAVFAEKSGQQLRMIFHVLLRKSLTMKEMLLTLAAVLLVGLLTMIWTGEKTAPHGKMKKTEPRFWWNRSRRFVRLLAISTALYVSYQLCTLGMYWFSMPMNEAFEVSGFPRYTSTILIAVWYLTAAQAMKLLSCVKEDKAATVIITSLLILGSWGQMYACEGNVRLPGSRLRQSPVRSQLQAAAEQYGVEPGASYIIFVSHEDVKLVRYIGKYLFLSEAVDVINVNEKTDREQWNADYLFILDKSNPLIAQWVQEHYPEQTNEQVIVTANRQGT